MEVKIYTMILLRTSTHPYVLWMLQYLIMEDRKGVGNEHDDYDDYIHST